MSKLKPGDVYYAFRSDIEPPHNKYQIYFDDETVLLINTDKSQYSINIEITTKDCPILDYDSKICIDTVFTYQKKYPIIKSTEISTGVLKKMLELVSMSNLLTGKQIKKIKRAISIILAERELF